MHQSEEVHQFGLGEAIWDWVREEVTRNVCLGTTAKVREKVGAFLGGLSERSAEVKWRRHTLSKPKPMHSVRQPQVRCPNLTIQFPLWLQTKLLRRIRGLFR